MNFTTSFNLIKSSGYIVAFPVAIKVQIGFPVAIVKWHHIKLHYYIVKTVIIG